MARRFRDPAQAKLYSLRLGEPADTRRTGLGSAYWTGRDHPARPAPFIRSSLCYAAWAAGVDVARKLAKES